MRSAFTYTQWRAQGCAIRVDTRPLHNQLTQKSNKAYDCIFGDISYGNCGEADYGKIIIFKQNL